MEKTGSKLRPEGVWYLITQGLTPYLVYGTHAQIYTVTGANYLESERFVPKAGLQH